MSYDLLVEHYRKKISQAEAELAELADKSLHADGEAASSVLHRVDTLRTLLELYHKMLHFLDKLMT